MARVYFEGPECPANVNEGAHWFDTDARHWRRFAAGQGWLPIADLNASRVKWAEAELDVLRDHFEAKGAQACARRIKGRCVYAIKMRARKLGLWDPVRPRGRFTNLAGADLEEAIRLRDEEGWSFERIGLRFGVAECSASNAYYIAMCPRRGFTPAKRTDNGHLLPAEIERMRGLLRKGLKAWEIQLRIGVSAACVAEQRRRYARYLKTNRKAPLPPPGGGERYSGARIERAVKLQVEAVYLAGHGTPRASKETGVSYTHCLRIRAKLIKRLTRKGELLPNCDRKGVRRAYVDSNQRIPSATVGHVRALLLDGVSHLRAANIVGIGDCSAYKIRCALRAELEAEGKTLPPATRAPRGQPMRDRWLPRGQRWIFFYRKLAAELGEQAARRTIEDGIAAIAAIPAAIGRLAREELRRRPPTFERQLARVADGAEIFDLRRAA